MPSSQRRLLTAALILAGLAGLALYFRKEPQEFSWSRLADAVANLRLSLVLAAVAAIFAAYASRALRWQRFCRHLGRCGFLEVYDGTLMGFSAVCLLSRAGEALRPVLLARKCRLPVATMFGIWLLERLFDVGAVAVILALSLLLPSPLLSNGGSAGWEGKIRFVGAAVAAGLAAAVIFIVYFRMHGAGLLNRLLESWRERQNWFGRIARHFAHFGDGLQAIRNLGDLSSGIFYSAVHWGLITAVYYLIIRSFGGRMGEFDVRAAMLLLIITLFGSVVQLPGVGGGTQILAYLGLTQIFGVDREPAAVAAMVLWIVNGCVVCLPGVPLLIREGWSISTLRQTAGEQVKAEEASAD